jgi:uncharacterized protein (TIGR02646 family)
VSDYYKELGQPVREKIIEQSLREQGHLCAYTNIRISATSCHVEHMFPQSSEQGGSDDPLEAIDYTNIVLCHPSGNLPDPPFGAKAKENWPNPQQRSKFLRPTDPTVEGRMSYESSGLVNATSVGDVASSETIAKLKLNDPLLVGIRRAAIDPLRLISRVDELRKRVKKVSIQEPTAEEHCIAKRQFLEHRLKKLEAKRLAIGRVKNHP